MTKRILLICSSCALISGIVSYVGTAIETIEGFNGFYALLLGSTFLSTITCLLCLTHASKHRRWDWVGIGLGPLLLAEMVLLVLLSPLVPSNAWLPASLETLSTLLLVVLPWLGPAVCLLYASLSSGSPAWMVRILGS